MEEILALQAQLARVQLSDSSHRISERNAVDIILKLVSMNKLNIIYAQNGKEYITPSSLVDEVDSELHAHGGRLALVELVPLLGVDLNHIEAAARTLCNKKNIQEIAGELITDYYLENVVEEIEELLASSGSLSLQSLAQRYTLPLALLNSCLSAHTRNIHDGILYTPYFLQTHRSKLRGILSAATHPCTLRSLMGRHGLLQDLVHKDVLALIDKKEIDGEIKGVEDRAVYTPAIYVRAQTNGALSFFRANHYILYSQLEKLAIASPKNFMQNIESSSIALTNAAIDKQIFLSVKDAFDDAVSCGLFVNASPLVPSALSSADVSQLCALVNNNNAQGNLHDTWFVTANFMQHINTFLDAAVEKFAHDEHQRVQLEESDKERRAPRPDNKDKESKKAEHDDDDDGNKKKKKGKKLAESDEEEEREKESDRKKKRGGKKQANDSDSEDDGAAKKKKGKKQAESDDEEEDNSKRKKKTKGKKQRDDDSDDDRPVVSKEKAKPSSKSAAATTTLSKTHIIKWLTHDWKTIVKQAVKSDHGLDVDEVDTLISALATHVHTRLLIAFRQHMSSLSASASSGTSQHDSLQRRQQMEAVRNAAQELFEQATIFAAAIQQIREEQPNEKNLVQQLDIHLNKTIFSQLLDILYRTETFFHCSPSQLQAAKLDDTFITTTQGDKSVIEVNRAALTLAQRQSMLALLGKKSQEALKSLEAATTSEEWMQRIDELTRQMEWSLKRIDKKQQRTSIFAMRKTIMSQLTNETRPALALQATVLLIYAKVYGYILHAPAKSVVNIRRLLQSSLHSSSYLLLRRFHHLIHRQLRAASASSDDAGMESEDDDQTRASDMNIDAVNKEVEERMEEIRKLGLEPSAAIKESKTKDKDGK